MAEKLSVDGAGRIATERLMQRSREHYNAAHDDKHKRGELVLAAICYAAPKPIYELREYHSDGRRNFYFTDPWPWLDADDKRDGKTRIRRLEVGGALIAAEIDRLLRLDGFDMP